jgi:glycosyltransferase involved in cell wall biosynthesis
LDAIIRAERDIPLVVFADPGYPGIAEWASLPKTKLVEVPFRSWSRARAQLWEQAVLPSLCREWNCPVAHHPMTTSPTIKRGIKSIVTLNDLNFLRHPEWFSRGFRLTYQFFAIPGLRRAEYVITISDYVSEHARRFLGIPDERLKRIYYGGKFLAGAAPRIAAPQPPPYLLCVGSLQPHKNLPRLIRAFGILRREQPDLELWVVGHPQPRFAAQPELTELLKEPGVKVLGYLSDEQLHEAYSHARLFCFPSLEEGFGLPLLEAMAAGTPVVTSNCSCLPEIAGPAARLIDPRSEEDLASGLREVLGLTEAARQRVIDEGRAWVKRFSWPTAAAEYLEIYRRVMGSA